MITPMNQFASVRAGLQEAGIPFDADISGLELIPVSEIEVSYSPVLITFSYLLNTAYN